MRRTPCPATDPVGPIALVTAGALQLGCPPLGKALGSGGEASKVAGDFHRRFTSPGSSHRLKVSKSWPVATDGEAASRRLRSAAQALSGLGRSEAFPPHSVPRFQAGNWAGRLPEG